MSPYSIAKAKQFGISVLTDERLKTSFVNIETPRLDCECILSYVLNVTRSFLLVHDDMELSEDQFCLFEQLINKRASGLPVAYIIGKKEFFGIDFFVNENVLIPKPDTEILVDVALKKIKEQNKEKFFIADICTGTGCIAISVLKSLSCDIATKCCMVATDISELALDVAKKNALSNSVKIKFLQGNLVEPIMKEYGKECYFDFILSNPPYVPKNIALDLLKDGRQEPLLALNGDCDGSNDGTGLIQQLIPHVWEILKEDGVFFIETGEYNSKKVMELLKFQGFSDVIVHYDYSGMPRVLEAKK